MPVKKGPPLQRPMSAQGPKIGGARFSNAPPVQKQNFYNDVEEEQEQVSNLPAPVKQRPSTSVQRMYSNDELRNNNNKAVNDSQDDDLAFVPKEMNPDTFLLQDIQRLIPKNSPLEKEKLYEKLCI